MNTGLSTVGIHPAIPALLDDCVVVGTQVKVDLPGKAATIAFVDSIEGPTVRLKDGSVRRVNTLGEAERFHDSLESIIDMGDASISYGDFFENNKTLSPSPYVTEWWLEDLRLAFDNRDAHVPTDTSEVGLTRPDWRPYVGGGPPTALEALDISRKLGIPLHPAYSPRFDRISPAQLLELRQPHTSPHVT